MHTTDYISHRDLYAFELRRLRSERKLSKARFSTMVGVSRRHLIKLEAAQASPTLEMMERLAAGLGVDIRDMVDFERIAQRKAELEGRAFEPRRPMHATAAGLGPDVAPVREQGIQPARSGENHEFTPEPKLAPALNIEPHTEPAGPALESMA